MQTFTDVHIDVDHPTIGAFGVCSKQAGYLEVTTVLEAFKEAGIPAELHPTPVGNSTALKRAMEDCCVGDKSLRVDSTGKHSKVVYSILHTDKSRLDLEQEENDGRGVSDAYCSARVEANGVGGLCLVIKPDNHEQGDYIRRRFDYHREHFKCSEDLSIFLSQRVFKSALVKATPRPGNAGGFYFVPRGDGLELLKRIDACFTQLSDYNGRTLTSGVKLYMVPMLTSVGDVLDAIVDSVIDDAERTMSDLEESLNPDKPLGQRALATKARLAMELEKKISSFASSMSTGFSDIEERVVELQKRIYLAEMAATKD